MKWPSTLFLVAALAGTMACSGPEVHYDYDVKVPLTGYHNWDWLAAPRNAPGGVFDNAIMSERVHRAIEAELGAKGFARDTSGDPDFLVVYYPARVGVHAHQAHLGLGLGMGPLGVGVAAPVGERHVETVGSIVVEVQDYRTRKLVWRAVAESVLNSADSPEEADQSVTEAVRAIFKKFPPGGNG
jgi:hypothetical protein